MPDGPTTPSVHELRTTLQSRHQAVDDRLQFEAVQTILNTLAAKSEMPGRADFDSLIVCAGAIAAADTFLTSGRPLKAHLSEAEIATVVPSGPCASALANVVKDEDLCAEMANLGSRDPAKPATTPDAEQSSSQMASDATKSGTSITSPHAGIALVLPLITGHLPGDARHPETLNKIAKHLLGDDTELHDPTFSALFPIPAGAPPAPDIPQPLHIADTALAGAAQRVGPAGWADVLMARFAAGLSGLQTSSRSYLRQQFLERPGRIDVSEDTVHVTLRGMPLAIVLEMGGLTGDRGPVAHLADRRLILTLVDGP